MKKLTLLFVSLILIAALLAGCASSSNSANDRGQSGSSTDGYNGGAGEYMGPEPAGMPQPEEPQAADDDLAGGFVSSTGDTTSKAKELAVQMGSKIIKSGYMSVETLDFEETTSAIVRRVQQAGGFIASSNVQGWSREDASYKPMRRAHYKIRIPSEISS